MAIADVVVIVIVALFALFGLLFGTAKSSISLFAWAVSFAGAVFATRFIAYALLDVDFVHGLVFGKDGFSIYNMVAPYSSGITADGILGKIFSPILNNVAAKYSGAQYDAAGAALVAYAIYSAIICIAAFFIIRLFMIIFVVILKKIFIRGDKKPGPVSRLLGFVINGVKGVLFAVIIFVFASFAFAFPLAGVVTADIDKSFIAKPMFGFIAPYSSQMISGKAGMDARIDEILTKSGVLDGVELSDEYKFTFNSNGGNDVEPQFAYEGSEITLPEEPVKDGYTFGGWFFDPECEDQPVQFPYTMPDSNMTAYAKWIPEGGPVTPQTYTVYIAANGAEDLADSFEVYEDGESVPLPQSLTKTDYTFCGWYFDDNDWNLPAGNEVTVSGGDVYVYAKWLHNDTVRVLELLQGDNSILYTAGTGGAVDAQSFMQMYSHQALESEDLLSAYPFLTALFDDMAKKTEGLDVHTELGSYELDLMSGSNFHTALGGYLDTLEALVSAIESNVGELTGLDAELQAAKSAQDAFITEAETLYGSYFWDVPDWLSGGSSN